MPTITAQGKTFNCEQGANLRRALLDNGINLYSPRANYINCMGLGTCGTCAVAIEGEISEANWRDIARRKLLPHNLRGSAENGNRSSIQNALRLACQTQVIGDIKVTKFEGFWGHESKVAWTPKGSG